MKDHADRAVADTKAAPGIDLDYTPESIQQVEHILSVVYDSKPRGLLSRVLSRALSGDEAAQVARMYGSYIGETIRRTWGGQCERDHAVAGAGSYPIECRGNQSFPLGWCYRRLMNGPEDNVWHKVLTIYLTNRDDNALRLD